MIDQTETQDSKNTESKGERSVKLEPTVRRELNKYAKKFSTKEKLAYDIGIARSTLRYVLKYGECNSETRDKIIAKVQTAA